MKKIIPLLWLLLLLNLSAFSQFVSSNNGLAISYIKSIIGLNKDTMYVAGSGGVAKSVDGGSNWANVFTGINAEFTTVYFLNKNVGFIGGYFSNNNIYKTIDGGQNWLPVLSSVFGSNSSISFSNDSTGYASFETGGGDGGKLYKTTDYGNNWSLLNYGSTQDLHDVLFINDSIGFVTGTKLYRTIDRGNNWSPINLNTPTSKLYFSNNKVFVSWGNGFCISENNGTTWNLTSQGINCLVESIDFPNNNIGFATTFNGATLCNDVYKTIDGGYNWNQIFTIPSTVFKDIFFVNDTIGYVVGTCGVLKTANGGINAHDITGTINYANSNNTPIAYADLALMNGNQQVSMTTSDVFGNYKFANVNDGSYSINISITKNWGGATSIDVLKIKRHIVGIELLTEPIKLTAADVSFSNHITATDVLKVSRRLAGLITTFTLPDWVFEKPSTGGNIITVNGSNVNQNFLALCAGDVDASYVPDFTISSCGNVTDIDGNTYNTVTIGSQCWMQENLKTTKYSDGTAIPNIIDSLTWSNLITGAYCNYNNTPSNSNIYGRLYNWYAANNTHNICPTGWHLPSDAEWNILEKNIENNIDTTLTGWVGTNIGGKLKETGVIHWHTPNSGATNGSAFNALPSGSNYLGSFEDKGIFGAWWSFTVFDTWSSWFRSLHYNNSKIGRDHYTKSIGFSIRCVKN